MSARAGGLYRTCLPYALGLLPGWGVRQVDAKHIDPSGQQFFEGTVSVEGRPQRRYDLGSSIHVPGLRNCDTRVLILYQGKRNPIQRERASQWIT